MFLGGWRVLLSCQQHGFRPVHLFCRNQVFTVPTCKTPLGRTLKAFWRAWKQNSVFSWLGGCWRVFLPSDGLWGSFWMIFGSIVGCSKLLFHISFGRHVKWTFGARVMINSWQICSYTTPLVKALCKAILCLAILSARYSNMNDNCLERYRFWRRKQL